MFEKQCAGVDKKQNDVIVIQDQKMVQIKLIDFSTGTDFMEIGIFIILILIFLVGKVFLFLYYVVILTPLYGFLFHLLYYESDQ